MKQKYTAIVIDNLWHNIILIVYRSDKWNHQENVWKSESNWLINSLELDFTRNKNLFISICDKAVFYMSGGTERYLVFVQICVCVFFSLQVN